MNIEEWQFQEITAGLNSRYQLWEYMLRTNKVEVMAEIGVWKGAFAKNILEKCEHIKRYYMIDPWTKLPDWNKPYNVSTEVFNEIYNEAMANTEFASVKRIVLRGTSKEIVDRILDESLDFAYIDGDHTLRGITIDLIKLFPKIKDGGMIGGDDFKPYRWQPGNQYEPTLVCPFSVYFAEAMNLPIIALPFNQFIIQKKANSSFSFTDMTGQFKDISLSKKGFKFHIQPLKGMIKRLVSSKLGFKS